MNFVGAAVIAPIMVLLAAAPEAVAHPEVSSHSSRAADSAYEWPNEFPISTPGETVPSASYNVRVAATTGAIAYFESRLVGSLYRWQLVFRSISASGAAPEELVGDPLPTGVTYPGGLSLLQLGDGGDFAIKVWGEDGREPMFTARQDGRWTPLSVIASSGDPTIRAAEGRPVVTSKSGAWGGPGSIRVEVRYPTPNGFVPGPDLDTETDGAELMAGFVDLSDPVDDFVVYQYFQTTDQSGNNALRLRTWQLVGGNWTSQDAVLANSPRSILMSPEPPRLQEVDGQLLATWTEFDGRANLNLQAIVSGSQVALVDPRQWPPGIRGYAYITARTGQRFAVTTSNPVEVFEQSAGEWRPVTSYRLTSQCPDSELRSIVGAPDQGPILLVSLLCETQSKTAGLLAMNRDYTWTKLPLPRDWNKLDVLPITGGTAFATGWNQAGALVGQWLKIQPITPPSQPTSVKASWSGKGKSLRVIVSWGPPTQNGGGTVTYETRLCSATRCGSWKANSSLRATLTPGTVGWITVQVRAINEAGPGPTTAAKIARRA